ncbi:hypothetical protein B0H16DRAFT_1745622 [Mycena metata]|uniref:Uncharacterized protein n=1 Tax=Mycena metata TaxID=1033252 RepID=A0AAD7H2I5_9AGAR|nr:hypothetical protein B0H16DRAFT_1745622 [Mycena metata]
MHIPKIVKHFHHQLFSVDEDKAAVEEDLAMEEEVLFQPKGDHDDDEMPSDEDWDECSPSDSDDGNNNDDMETDVDDKENIPILAQEAPALALSKLQDPPAVHEELSEEKKADLVAQIYRDYAGLYRDVTSFCMGRAYIKVVAKLEGKTLLLHLPWWLCIWTKADLIQTDGTTKPAGTTIVGYDTA